MIIIKNILISISDDALIFSYYNKTTNLKTLANTNIIDTEELVFGVDYLNRNKKIVLSFLNELMNEHNISKFILDKYEIALETIQVLKGVKKLQTIQFVEDKSLPYSVCELLIECKELIHLDCASIPPYMIEILDRNGIGVETRSEILFTSKFMAINNLSQYSKIFYKTNVRIEDVFDEIDYRDFETFCKVNKYLNTVHLYVIDLEMLKKIVEIMHNLRVKNIDIQIHKNLTDKAIVEELRILNREFKSKYNITLNLVYSDNYLKNNLFTQVIINFLKTCCIVVIIIVITVFGVITFNNYLSKKNVDTITSELEGVIKDAKEQETETEEDEATINSKFSALLEVNSDTVGWLSVNNTKIDYPIVRGTDNTFYLSHDFYKNKEYNGWVYMDYRNSVAELGRNTILYGHNRFNSGLMFGTLNDVQYRKWYTNEENLIIKFDTIYEEHTWKVFSIYKIGKTNDYIQTQFADTENYLEFANMLKNRSLIKFDVEITETSKILTLSTCLENDNRLVLHAVIVEE